MKTVCLSDNEEQPNLLFNKHDWLLVEEKMLMCQAFFACLIGGKNRIASHCFSNISSISIMPTLARSQTYKKVSPFLPPQRYSTCNEDASKMEIKTEIGRK